jgi:hypothetical protein
MTFAQYFWLRECVADLTDSVLSLLEYPAHINDPGLREAETILAEISRRIADGDHNLQELLSLRDRASHLEDAFLEEAKKYTSDSDNNYGYELDSSDNETSCAP